MWSYVPSGLIIYSYIVPIPNTKEHSSKALTFDDLRGIAISPIIAKVFEHSILERFQLLFSTSRNQFRFKKGVSCNHAVCLTRSTIDNIIYMAAALPISVPLI